VPVDLPPEPNQTAGRQTLMTVAIQSVPNTVLVDFDPQSKLVLIHVLSPEEDPVASLTRWTTT
jgi:multisubunit Na+/H+ antiporter MnhE subunit